MFGRLFFDLRENVNGIEGKAVYCKNCGKKLPDDARFCDRCNMSVRKMGSKMEMIEELKEERLARKKAKAVQERYKKMQQRKKHRNRMIAGGIALVLVLGIISAVASNVYYRKNSGFNAPSVTETPKPSQTAGAAASPSAAPGTASTPANGTAAVSPNSDGYIETAVGGVGFAYPRGYERINGSGAYLSLRDSTGNAVITADAEETESSVVELMKQYIDSMGGTFVNSFTGSSWYTADVAKGSEMYHRCGVVADGTHVWYEMRYPSASDKEGEYTETIEYMDKFLTEG